MRLLAALALGLAAPALAAASAAEIVAAAEASLTDVQRQDPAAAARAEAIAAALEAVGDLPAAERLAVQVALAEAWLDGSQPERCLALATAVQADAASTPALRERAALARSAAARALLRAEDEQAAAAALAALAAAGDAGPRAAAHREVVGAEMALRLDAERKPRDGAAALAALDRALALLAEAPPAERVPVYLLRLTAMERGGAKPEEVLAWIEARKPDPAAAEVLPQAATANDRMVGQPAPALKAPRLDRAGEVFDLASLRGRAVLVDFFASWCKPCAFVAPAVADFAAAHPELAIVGVSLDNPQTIGDLPAFLAAHRITWPVIGEQLGWDGELDDAWRVDGIPALILVAPDGTIAATGLVGGTVDETTANLERALQALSGPPPAQPRAPAPPRPAAPFP